MMMMITENTKRKTREENTRDLLALTETPHRLCRNSTSSSRVEATTQFSYRVQYHHHHWSVSGFRLISLSFSFLFFQILEAFIWFTTSNWTPFLFSVTRMNIPLLYRRKSSILGWRFDEKKLEMV